MNQAEALSAVMDEQDRQLRVGRKDEDSLGRIYHIRTAQCAARAYKTGLDDELTACEIMSKTVLQTIVGGQEKNTMSADV